jgi:hypothetical protein
LIFLSFPPTRPANRRRSWNTYKSASKRGKTEHLHSVESEGWRLAQDGGEGGGGTGREEGGKREREKQKKRERERKDES